MTWPFDPQFKVEEGSFKEETDHEKHEILTNLVKKQSYRKSIYISQNQWNVTDNQVQKSNDNPFIKVCTNSTLHEFGQSEIFRKITFYFYLCLES